MNCSKMGTSAPPPTPVRYNFCMYEVADVVKLLFMPPTKKTFYIIIHSVYIIIIKCQLLYLRLSVR